MYLLTENGLASSRGGQPHNQGLEEKSVGASNEMNELQSSDMGSGNSPASRRRMNANPSYTMGEVVKGEATPKTRGRDRTQELASPSPSLGRSRRLPLDAKGLILVASQRRKMKGQRLGRARARAGAREAEPVSRFGQTTTNTALNARDCLSVKTQPETGKYPHGKARQGKGREGKRKPREKKSGSTREKVLTEAINKPFLDSLCSRTRVQAQLSARRPDDCKVTANPAAR